MNTKKLLLLVLTLLCVTCLAFSACQQTPNSNAISGLTDISLKCGDTLPTIAPVAEYGTVTVTIAKAVDGTAKENLTYEALPNTLPQVGTYYLKATVQAGDNYEGATAYATLTISHKSFAEIAGEGENKHEVTSDGKYHTWTEKQCACGTTIVGNDSTVDKVATTISGLNDVTLVCGSAIDVSGISADHGTVVVEIAKAVEGTEKENLTYGTIEGTYNYGTYYLRASVAEGDSYKGAVAYAKVTINHQAFENIAGDGEDHSEVTTDNKFHSWTEKTCVCGATVIGNEQTADKKANNVKGLPAELTLVCGSAIDVSGVSATNGTPVIKVAVAVEGTAKEDLTYIDIPSTCTHGVYYVRATVAESDEYLAAAAYAKVTVNHQAYGDITTEVQHQAAEGTTKGYDYKLCACGERIHGETEYVIVTIKQDGAVIDTQELAIGANVTRPADDKITARSGYVATLLLNGEVWNAGETAEDFATIELTTRWVIKDDAVIDKVKTNWLFITEDTGLTEETVNKLTEEDTLWKVETLYNPDKPASPAELELGDIQLKINHTYQFTVVSTHRTYVCFGTGTWDTNCYLITEDMANKPVVITITYTGSNTIVTYNGETRTYTNTEWPVHNLNGLTFAIQDKDAKDETEHPRFTVSISKQVIDLYDYVADEARLVASLPAVDSIDADNAEDVLALISQIEALRTAHFTTAQNASATDVSAHKQKAQQIAADHVLNLKKLENALPDFDTMWTADKDTQDAAYKALTKYLAYYNVKFTAEEKETYTEPEKIAFYREFFKDRTIVTDNAFAESTTSFIPWDTYPTTHWNPNNQSGTITLPQIAYGAYDQVTFILVSAGGETRTLTYGDYVVTDNWGQFIITKQADGWYANFAVPDAHTGNGVKLSDEIVLGNEGIQVQFQNSGWGWLRIQSTGNDSSINQILGTLTAGTTTVHKITYSYQTNAGEQTKTEYYLNNGTLVLPNVSDYTDKVGKHTFLGWFVGDTQYNAGAAITASATLVAKYEIREGDYINYTVSFVDEAGEKLAEPQTYHYGETLVLPETPKAPPSTDECMHNEFKGWFVGETQYVGGEKITAKLTLCAQFVLVDDTREQFNVTLTNLDGENQTVSVYDGEVAELPTVTRDGYVFDGWYKDGSKYDTEAEVTDNITLVAKWLIPNAYKGMVGTFTDASGEGTAVTDSAWVDSNGNAFTKYWTPDYQGDNVWIKVPTTLFATNDSLEMFVEITGETYSLTCDNVTTDDGYMGGKDIGYKLQIRFYKQGTTWYIKTAQWAKEIPAEVISGDVVTMHVWCNTHEAVKVSEVVGYGNVDYVAKATEAATAIENLAVDADNATKLAALKTYMSWRSHFTTAEYTANPMSAKATELQTALKTAGVVDIVWMPTTANLTEIKCDDVCWDISDRFGNGAVSIQGKAGTSDTFTASNWFQPNKNGNGERTDAVTLPKINYAMYSEVRFAIWVQNTTGTTQSLTINGTEIPMDKVADTRYVVYVTTINGTTTFSVYYAGTDVVVKTGSIPAAVANGREALTLSLYLDGWTRVDVTEFYGTL